MESSAAEAAVATKNPINVVVLEVGMHCDSCASEIEVSARTLNGVENVTVDIDSNKLTVIGKVDPIQIRNDLRRKIKKTVDIVSTQSKKGNTTTVADENRPDINKKDTATGTVTINRESHEKKPNEYLMITIVVLKLGHYCQGCSSKICKIVLDTNGVREMFLDEQKEMVTVKGTMDSKVLMENLKERLNRTVEIVSVTKERYSNDSVKDSENGSNEGKEEKIRSEPENGSDVTEMEGSIMNLKSEKTPETMVVFKVPLHCDGCTKKIRKIIRSIRGVQEVSINKEEETVTVKATIDVKTLTDTIKKRLKKLVEERKIEIAKVAEVVKDTSQYSFGKQDHKQESSPQLILQFSQQQQTENFVICIPDLNEGRNQGQSPVSLGDAHTKLNSEIRESSPTSETAEWAFLMMSLLLEVVSCVLDQWGYLCASMLLSFAALLLSTIELVHMARREGLITLERSRSTCPYYHLTYNSPPSELFVAVHFVGFIFAVWQSLNSTVQYIYSLRNLDNPIKMSLLPVIFLLCVFLSKIIRKMEEINCQDLNRARDKIQLQSDLSPLRLSGKTEQNGQNSKRMETGIDVQSDSSELVYDPLQFGCGYFGCSHYKRRCKIRATCCPGIFGCWQCHNEAKNAVETSPGDRHPIRRQEIIKVICFLCVTEQDVHQNCIRCGVCMGKYFCAKCKFFDDDVSKNQYHCDECGICRDEGSKIFFHCKKCGRCHPKSNDNAHHCMEKEMHQD